MTEAIQSEDEESMTNHSSRRGLSDGQRAGTVVVSERKMAVVVGVFDGETMDLDLESGTISWQNLVYTRG